jgi:hypothetical protein
LAAAESNYRCAADLLGEAHPLTQKAWEALRNAGDNARAAEHLTMGGGR